jgi:hypothetical protein
LHSRCQRAGDAPFDRRRGLSVQIGQAAGKRAGVGDFAELVVREADLAWLGLFQHLAAQQLVDRCDGRVVIESDEIPACEPEAEPLWRRFDVESVVGLLPLLNKKLRDVFALHVEGCSVPVIAVRLRIPVAKVSARLYRARRRLRSWLLAGTRPPETPGPSRSDTSEAVATARRTRRPRRRWPFRPTHLAA